MSKPVIPRKRAREDIDAAIDHYLREAGEPVALGFIDALEAAYQIVANHPAAGSTRYAHELSLTGLRCWPLKGYPYLLLYIELEDRIDLGRLLHVSLDIPAWMAEGLD